MISMVLRDTSISYINMETFVEIFGKYLMDYNWLISDIECVCDIEEIETMLLKDYVWLTGKRLLDLEKDTNLSFSWAVFSGFKKEIEKKDILKYPIPYADGNSDNFENNKSLQNPLAEIEIIVFDSTFLVIRSCLEEMGEDLKSKFSNMESF